MDTDFPFYVGVKFERAVLVAILDAKPVHWVSQCNPVAHQYTIYIYISILLSIDLTYAIIDYIYITCPY